MGFSILLRFSLVRDGALCWSRCSFGPQTDINECHPSGLSSEYHHLAHICHDDANCTNTNGSYYCTCLEGYSGQGEHCSGKILRMASVCILLITGCYHQNLRHLSIAIEEDNTRQKQIWRLPESFSGHVMLNPIVKLFYWFMTSREELSKGEIDIKQNIKISSRMAQPTRNWILFLTRHWWMFFWNPQLPCWL